MELYEDSVAALLSFFCCLVYASLNGLVYSAGFDGLLFSFIGFGLNNNVLWLLFLCEILF